MKKVTYSIIGLINGQEFTSKGNTYEEFKALVDMIHGFGGNVIEYTEEHL